MDIAEHPSYLTKCFMRRTFTYISWRPEIYWGETEILLVHHHVVPTWLTEVTIEIVK